MESKKEGRRGWAQRAPNLPECRDQTPATISPRALRRGTGQFLSRPGAAFICVGAPYRACRASQTAPIRRCASPAACLISFAVYFAWRTRHFRVSRYRHRTLFAGCKVMRVMQFFQWSIDLIGVIFNCCEKIERRIRLQSVQFYKSFV